MSSSKSYSKYIILGVLLLAVIGFILNSIPAAKPKPQNIEVKPSATKEYAFNKEGTLHIQTMGGDSVVTIDIELADTEEERTRGMMFRQSLGGLQGMLFLFDKVEPQSFWMKNTLIPLDIIFISEDGRIVDQYQNAQPKSTKNIRSRRPAKYVLEVNAGFCRAYNTGPGMQVDWQLN